MLIFLAFSFLAMTSQSTLLMLHFLKHSIYFLKNRLFSPNHPLSYLLHTLHPLKHPMHSLKDRINPVKHPKSYLSDRLKALKHAIDRVKDRISFLKHAAADVKDRLPHVFECGCHYEVAKPEIRNATTGEMGMAFGFTCVQLYGPVYFVSVFLAFTAKRC